MILIDTTFLKFGKTGIGTVINQILNLFQNENIEYKQISYFDYFSNKSTINWYNYFNKILISEIKKLSKEDIFLFPENLGGIIHFPRFKCKTIFIIYDLFELKNKTKLRYIIEKVRFSSILRRVTKIITISDFCKNDIGFVFPKIKEKLTVIYPFYIVNHISNTRTSEITDWGDKNLITNKYLLANGSGQERKNAIFLIKNAERIYNDFGLKLILFGKDFYNDGYNNIKEAIKTYNAQDFVIHLGPLTDEMLCYAYKHASCFVFPSLDEGFGLPPVEALLNHCRIAVSDIQIFREILTPLDRFFTFSYDSLSNNISKVLKLTQSEFEHERNMILEKFKYENYKKQLEETLFS